AFLFSSFFFQAEDGIRDFHVTGVQTCALPIYLLWNASSEPTIGAVDPNGLFEHASIRTRPLGGRLQPGRGDQRPFPRFAGQVVRSEERRVGKEGRSRWAQNNGGKALETGAERA